jgi:tripeptidyl-peptidase-1
MNKEMMALGVRGVSVLFASGDSGYVAAQKYGAASPYVTAVGGVFNGELGYDVLQVDSKSTGGFSSLDSNPIQPYQTAAVAAWQKTKGARPGGFNVSHRCVPDITAYDYGFHFIKNGEGTAVIGTSCAAPASAGMFSLINDALLNAGGKPLGFLNPFLYKTADAFYDITKGNNGGFDATVGYDPASGLGTFDGLTFTKLKDAALKGRGHLN